MGGAVSKVTDTLGLTDSGAAGTAQRNAEYTQRQILDRLAAIDLPNIEDMEIALQDPELVGLLEQIMIPDSEMDNIQTDASLKQAQMDALRSLRDQSESGLTSEDRLAMESMLGQAAEQGQAREQSMLQGMNRRGTMDSGMQLAAMLQGQQSDATNARKNAMEMAAQSSQARRSALQNMAGLAGNMEAADYQRQSNAAQARDAIAKANAVNKQQIGNQNLGMRQNISDRTTANRQQEEMFNKGLIQQDFQNKLSKAGAQGQAQGNMANMYTNQAQNIAANNSQMMQSLITGAATAAKAAAASDVRAKENIKVATNPIENMLNNLTEYEYDYKDEYKEDMGDEGRQLGVMAQDLEQSPLGQEFVQEDMNGTKRVDYGKMGSTQMAALVNLHNRLKKIEGR